MDHHPDIQAALNVFADSAPFAAERAGQAIGILLRQAYRVEKRSVADRQAAWNFSTLTGDGYPLEWAFTSADHQLRYTVDPGGADILPADRLAYAAGLLAELGQPVDQQFLEELKSWHRAAPVEILKYGAWVGGRHSIAGSTDHFKLYIETPASCARSTWALLASSLNPLPRLPEREIQLRMLGWEPSTGRLEFYFRVLNLPASSLSFLLYPAGLRSRADELLDQVGRAYGYSLQASVARIPGGSVGFSYALRPDTDQVTFTLFLSARILWGGDSHIRTRFCEWLTQAGVDPRPHGQMTAQVASRNVYETYHGLVGFILTADVPIQLSLGVRPPPVQDRSELLSRSQPAAQARKT